MENTGCDTCGGSGTRPLYSAGEEMVAGHRPCPDCDRATLRAERSSARTMLRVALDRADKAEAERDEARAMADVHRRDKDMHFTRANRVEAERDAFAARASRWETEHAFARARADRAEADRDEAVRQHELLTGMWERQRGDAARAEAERDRALEAMELAHRGRDEARAYADAVRARAEDEAGAQRFVADANEALRADVLRKDAERRAAEAEVARIRHDVRAAVDGRDQ